MKIGIVTAWFERGAAYVSRQYMDVLQKTDEVFIYARGGERFAIGDPKWDLPNVHWGKRSEAKKRIISDKWIDKKDFCRWINATQVEAILFNEQIDYEPIIWCKDLGIKALAYVDYYNERTIPFFDAYDCLICNTKRHAFAFRRHRNVKYIRWGTDLNLYKPTNDPHEKLTFFHSAGMAPIRKGTDILIDAFYNMDNRKNVKLLIHTQVPLSKKIPDSNPYIIELLNEGSLEIIEKTIPAPGLYYRGDVYVYPSRLDGIGLTLMEAAASGLAILTTNNPPMNEFVEDSFGTTAEVEYQYSRIDGYYWPMAAVSSESLTDKLNWFYNNRERIDAMKNAARNYATAFLDFDKNCEGLHDVFEKTVFTPLSESQKKELLAYTNRNGRKYLRFLVPLYPIIKRFI